MEQLQLLSRDINETKRDINEAKRDIAVLGSEVGNFKRVMERLDEAITAMSRVSANLERLLIQHEERIKTNDTNLVNHKNSVEDAFVTVNTRLLKLEEHKEQVNKWRWQIYGAWSVICVLTVGMVKLSHLIL